MRTCVIAGSSLYRLPIYNQMAKDINCDFYVSADNPQMGIVTYDCKDLLNFKGQLSQEKRILGNFTWIRGMVSLFFKPYDIFIIGGPYGLPGWIMLVLSKFSKKKVASWSHGMYGKETGLRKYIKIVFYKLCDLNFVYNERALQLMKECGIKPDKNVCVYNSLDTDKDLVIRDKLSIQNYYKNLFKNNLPIIIFVGRITSVKRLDLVIKSMKLLSDRNKPVNFLLVGKDVENMNLHELVKECDLEKNVHFFGPCYDDEILGNFFYNADVCVSPGNVGLTAMSAMSFGCPVISHNDFAEQMPEFEAIKPGKTGDFFAKDNIEDLSNKIEIWVSKTLAQREEIRKNCFEEIDSRWNIYSESNAFKKALM